MVYHFITVIQSMLLDCYKFQNLWLALTVMFKINIWWLDKHWLILNCNNLKQTSFNMFIIMCIVVPIQSGTDPYRPV